MYIYETKISPNTNMVTSIKMAGEKINLPKGTSFGMSYNGRMYVLVGNTRIYFKDVHSDIDWAGVISLMNESLPTMLQKYCVCYDLPYIVNRIDEIVPKYESANNDGLQVPKPTRILPMHYVIIFCRMLKGEDDVSISNSLFTVMEEASVKLKYLYVILTGKEIDVPAYRFNSKDWTSLLYALKTVHMNPNQSISVIDKSIARVKRNLR